MRVRFDKRPTQSFSAGEASDGTSNVIFVRNASRLIKELKKSKTTAIEIELYQAGVQALEFRTEEFKWP